MLDLWLSGSTVEILGLEMAIVDMYAAVCLFFFVVAHIQFVAGIGSSPAGDERHSCFLFSFQH